MLEWVRQRGLDGGVLIFFDLKGAFDSCQWNIMEAIMKAQGWGDQATGFLLSRLKVSVRIRDPATGKTSRPIQKEAGTPQGEVLSPALFLVFMGVLLEAIARERSDLGHSHVLQPSPGCRGTPWGQCGYADDYVAAATTWTEACQVVAVVTELFELAGLELGFRPVSPSGLAKKTAMMPFGLAADSFPRGWDDDIACTATEVNPSWVEQTWTVPRAKSYVYLGLLISTTRIHATAAELGPGYEERDVIAIDMVPHVRRRVAMAMQQASIITRAAVDCDWSVRLHSQILYSGALTSALYGIGAAGCATGWERFRGLEQRISVNYGVIMNAAVLSVVDRFLARMRWMLATGMADRMPFAVEGRRLPKVALDSEVWLASAAGRTARDLFELMRAPDRRGLPVVSHYIRTAYMCQ